MTKPSKTIALLADSLNFDYAQLLAQAVWQEANRRSLAVVTFVGNRLGVPGTPEATPNHIFDLVTARRVDGVVSLSAILASASGGIGVAALCQRLLPIPLCSVGIAIPGVPSLVVDNLGGMAGGVRHLIEHHGRRKIAFIAGPRANPEAHDRLTGYRQTLIEHGIEPREELVEYGDFTLPSGREAMLELIARTRDFDAVVAANDYMALASIEVLRGIGISVPDAVAVCGFDDINAAACTTPSLTSLRQPLWELGMQAVACIVDQWQGRPVVDCAAMPLGLIVRDSCGCKHHVAATERGLPRNRATLEALHEQQAQIQARLKPLIQVPNQALGEWPRRLLDALAEELRSAGQFLPAFEHLLIDAHAVGVNLAEFQQVVTELRRSVQRLQNQDERGVPEHVWHQARIQCCDRAIQMAGRQRIEEQQTISLLGRSSERLATSLSVPRFRDVLADELPGLGIRAASISLVSDPRRSSDLSPLLLLGDGEPREVPMDTISETELGPSDVFETSERNPSPHRVVLPLTFESDFLGVAVLDTQCIPSLYDAIRQQMGSALKGALLHRQVIEQIAVRERFERERVLEATRLASELQTKLNPRAPVVRGLEIAACMLPAAEAGGDYYDVIPIAGGAWLGIGDVTGHGLNAGIIMMMMHSMITGLVHHDPHISPADLVVALNRALYQGIHHRLRRDDQATLMLLKYGINGMVTFAGEHEPPIVYRAATDQCEMIESAGFWVGSVPDIAPFTRNATFRLQDGDVMVLYTDGITEPRNAHNEQFGPERLGEHLRRWARSPVEEIRERLMAAAREWTNDWTDDVTLMVVRYRSPAAV